MDVKEIVSSIGELKGITIGINQQITQIHRKLDNIDERLRVVEQRSLKNGLMGGAVISAIINVGLKLIGLGTK